MIKVAEYEDKGEMVIAYVGFDLEQIEAHPKDGSNGMMLVFIPEENRIDQEEANAIRATNNNYLLIKEAYIENFKVDARAYALEYINKLDKIRNSEIPWLAVSGIKRGKLE